MLNAFVSGFLLTLFIVALRNTIANVHDICSKELDALQRGGVLSRYRYLTVQYLRALLKSLLVTINSCAPPLVFSWKRAISRPLVPRLHPTSKDPAVSPDAGPTRAVRFGGGKSG